jgi:hypothetical protein
MKNDNLSPGNLIDRAGAKTPKFWKKVQRFMLVLGGVGGALLTSGVALPGVIAAALPYLVTAGVVGSVLPQFAKESEANSNQIEP